MDTKQKLITRLKNNHVVKQTLCGEIHEILLGAEYTPNIAIALNIGSTTAHYHKEFNEIYFVLDGDILLKLYDPDTGEYTDQKLEANELCVITKGIHHKIVEASKENRLCVISVPYFNGDDEYISEKL